MKTIRLVSVVIAAFFMVSAYADFGYVITANETIMCSNMKMGIKNARVTLLNGEKTKIDKDQILSFQYNGSQFDRMPVYENGQNTGKTRMMQLLCQRNGLRLYKCCAIIPSGWDNATNTFESTRKVTMLHVYKDGKYYLQLDKNNAKTLAEFFHLKNLKVI
jgi:hypothetical protein